MRAENKGLKKSQIDERIFKAWQKSDENPMKAGNINPKAIDDGNVAFVNASNLFNSIPLLV